MGFLSINYTGEVVEVQSMYDTSIIGHIYPKERFTTINKSDRDVAANGEDIIRFRTSWGTFELGNPKPTELSTGYPQSNYDLFFIPWGQLSFGIRTGLAYSPDGNGLEFHIDADVNVYFTSGDFMRTIPAGSLFFSDYATTSGYTHPEYMFGYGYSLPGDGSYVHASEMFIDTEIDLNSTNTPVYGDWN